MDSTCLISIVVSTIVIIAVILFTQRQSGEGYQASHSGEFSVKYPKYNTPPSFPAQRMKKEGWIIPTPQKSQLLKSSNLGGGTVGPLSNPFLGGLPNELKYGVSAASGNVSTTVSGNGAGDPMATAVWKTVI